MKSRCSNPNYRDSHRYVGRGITVAPRWERFESFLEDMGEAPEGMTLERIDNNKGYSPDNCRWATPYEQAQNRGQRSDAIIVRAFGLSLRLKEWAAITGESYWTLVKRMQRGGCDDEIVVGKY